MSDNIYYEAFGEISGKTPLEPFYNRMLPLLKNYGLTAEFPADKPSLAYDGVMGIKFDVWIGEPPAAIRYKKWQESPYSMGGFELTLESETLVHNGTGDNLSLKIFLTDYISGLTHANGNLWLTVRFSGAESEVERLKNVVAPVLAEYNFRSRHEKNAPLPEAANNNFPITSIDNSKSDFMTNNVNFDELSKKSFAPGAGEADYERLFAAVFNLPEWHFIADGEFPNLSPYCALFPDSFGEQPAVAVFTDAERARKFMAESSTSFGSADKSITLNNDGITVKVSSEDLILSVPTANILDYIEKLLPKGIVKIFFNPNKDSHGFSNDLKIMRPIREHLESQNMLSKSDAKTNESSAAVSPPATNPLVEKATETVESSAEANFDALSVKATQTNAREDLNNLFGEAFALPEWHFIARGELPSVVPYVASNPQYAGNQPMIRAFTDTKRLMRFAKENNLTKADGSCDILTIPTGNIIQYLEGFIPSGAHGIWFNSDTTSDGFFIPLKQLRPIKEHLAKINWRKENAQKSSVETIHFVVKEGLMLPSAEIKPAPYTSNLFWRVPSDWVENGKIKTEHLGKIERAMSGGRSEIIEGAFYTVIDYSTKIFEPEEAKTVKWSGIVNDDDNLYRFFVAFENGEIKKVTAEEFAKDIEASSPAAQVSEQQRQSNLANWGLAESPDGGTEQMLTINQVGAVHFDTSIAAFYQAIVPLLENYQGSGEYQTLLRFEPSGMSDLVENITENAHGAYLQIRRFLYLNPKNNVRIGVNSIHSKELRHIQSNGKLLISLELCKNLDNQTAAFYFAFLGAGGEVKKLVNAIQPVLTQCGYEGVSQ